LDPDPHKSERLVKGWIRIRIKVKRRIRIYIKVANRVRIRIKVTKQDQDPAPDPHQYADPQQCRNLCVLVYFLYFFLLPLIRLIYLIRRLTLDDITILEDNSVRTEKLRVCDVDWRFEVKLIDVGNPVGFSAL
jgi:hypothetical protein